MESIKELFELDPKVNKKGVLYKNDLAKRQIVAYMAVQGESSIASLSKYIGISIPSVTKLIGELVDDGFVVDKGKIATEGGRRPNIYGLSGESMYFLGVYVGFDGVSMVLTDLHSDIAVAESHADFFIENTQESFDAFYDILMNFIDRLRAEDKKIIGLGVSLVGRVNPQKGEGYAFYNFLEQPMSQILEQKTGIKTLVENDVRAKCYAEYFAAEVKPNNAIFLELGMGVAIGIIIGGELYYGNSGFAGEFGHVPFSDNNILCYCGKKGCLETEISARAVERKMGEKLARGLNSKLSESFRDKGYVSIEEIEDAANADDNLAIETLIEVADDIGRGVSFLINVFNPETITIGGRAAGAGEHLLLPIKSAVSKYSIRLVASDTEIKMSSANFETSALGAALLIRKNILGI